MVPSVLVAGRDRGFAGALAARLIDRHPYFRLSAVTSRSDAGTPLNELYPHHRVPLVLEELDLDLDRHGEVDAAIVAYPHGAAAPLVAELLEGGIKVVDLSADFRLRDLKRLRGVLRPARRTPSCWPRRSTGCPSSTARPIAETDLVAGPGCYPTAAILTLAPLARAGLIDDVVIDAKSGVSGRGPRRDAEDALRDRRRERSALRRRHPPPRARDRPGAGGARCRRHGDVHPAPAAARPGRAGLLLRRRPPRWRRATSSRSTRRPTPPSRSSTSSRARPACATSARPTSARSTSRPIRAPARCWPSARSTTCGRGRRRRPCSRLNLMFGRDETEGLL